MFVDSHCHPNLAELKNQTEEVLKRMQQAKVTQALCIAVNLEDIDEVLALAQNHSEFWASVGVHPEYKNVIEPDVEMLIQYAQHPKVIAVGETGLDYHWEPSQPDWQKKRFRTHIRAACQIGKPLVIHTRCAIEDTLNILKEEQAQQCSGIMHCFTEDKKAMQSALDLGFYISFSGILTFKKAQMVQEAARYCPLDRMLIETDAPFLSPEPKRGKINEPSFVIYTAKKLASIKQMELEEIAQLTTENFHRLFPQTKDVL